MSLAVGLKRFLLVYWKQPGSVQEKEALDGVGAVFAHRAIIESKPLLQTVYARWYNDYRRCLKATANLIQYPAIELGSGAGLSKKFCPEILRTDVVANPNVDKVVSAQELPFDDQSLRAICMLDVLHHLPSPRLFFKEASRCLVTGGRVVMIEPTNSFFSRLILGNLHPSESFEPDAKTWESTHSVRQSEANMAIPWIIFERDRATFEKEFPHLKIASIKKHTVLGYFITGGLSYKPFLPFYLGRLWLWIEALLVQIFPALATMMTVELIKEDNA